MGQTFKSDRHSLATAFEPADMAAKVMAFAPATGAEALKLLRASFPECPLSMRIAALDYLTRRAASGRPTNRDRPAARDRR